jgi:hypothetical protein
MSYDQVTTHVGGMIGPAISRLRAAHSCRLAHGLLDHSWYLVNGRQPDASAAALAAGEARDIAGSLRRQPPLDTGPGRGPDTPSTGVHSVTPPAPDQPQPQPGRTGRRHWIAVSPGAWPE